MRVKTTGGQVSVVEAIDPAMAFAWLRKLLQSRFSRAFEQHPDLKIYPMGKAMPFLPALALAAYKKRFLWNRFFLPVPFLRPFPGPGVVSAESGCGKRILDRPSLCCRVPGVPERLYAVTVMRRIKHPAVAAICDAAETWFTPEHIPDRKTGLK